VSNIVVDSFLLQVEVKPSLLVHVILRFGVVKSRFNGENFREADMFGPSQTNSDKNKSNNEFHGGVFFTEFCSCVFLARPGTWRCSAALERCSAGVEGQKLEKITSEAKFSKENGRFPKW
jgi:hypothetical protein